MGTVRHNISLAAAVLCLLALSACGSDSGDAAPSSATTASATSRATPSSTPSTSSPSPTASSIESLGKEMGAKIGFYAVAKGAGMTETAKMDQLAEGICSRIGSGKAEEVGPWVKDTFQLEGDVAARVAVIAIEVQCPEFKSKMGL